MQMGERNTFPCSGCGKPFLQAADRKRHEASCSLVDSDSEPEETEPDAESDMEDQDTYQEPPEPAVPEEPASQELKPAPEPRPVQHERQPAGCQCCGSEVDTTRQGLCYGCDLAGCSSGSGTCKHRSGAY